MRCQQRVAPVLHAPRDPRSEGVVVADSPQVPRGDCGERDLEAKLRSHALAKRGQPDVLRHSQLPDVVRGGHPDLNDDLPVLRCPSVDYGCETKGMKGEGKLPKGARRGGADRRDAEDGDLSGECG